MYYNKKIGIILSLFILILYTSGIQMLQYGNSNWDRLRDMPITYLNKKHIVNKTDSNGGKIEDYMIYVKDETYNKKFYLSTNMERYYNIKDDTRLILANGYAPSSYAALIGLDYVCGQEYEKYSIFGTIIIIISFGMLIWLLFYGKF